MSISVRDRRVALETVRPRSECPHCNPGGIRVTASTNELSKLSLTDKQIEFSAAQKKALVDTLKVHHATDADLMVFFHQARRTGLDPFLRQIYCIARQEYNKETNRREWRQTFQCGIDGFRVVAHRRARQLNQVLTYEDTVYYDAQGNKHEVWIGDEAPSAVRVTVHMGQSRFPFIARFSDYVVLKDEYAPDTVDADGKKVKGEKTGNRIPSGMWASRPTGQLEKCAEAGALRRACPQDLSGIYEFAEMERPEPVTTLVEDGRPAPKPNADPSGRDWLAELKAATEPGQVNEIWQACKDAGERTEAFDEALGVAVQRIRAAAAAAEAKEAEDAAAEEVKAEAEWGVIRSYEDNSVLRPATQQEWEHFSSLPEDEAAVLEIDGEPFYIDRDEPQVDDAEQAEPKPEQEADES